MSNEGSRSESTVEIFIPYQPEDPKHLLPAIGFINLGMPEEALEELEKLSPEQKSEEQVYDMRLQICNMMSKFEEGLELASSLAAKFPDEYAWPNYMADFLRSLGRLDEAFEVARKMANDHPDAYPPHYSLAAYACLVGKLEIARSALNRAIEIWPDVKNECLDDPDLAPILGQVS